MTKFFKSEHIQTKVTLMECESDQTDYLKPGLLNSEAGTSNNASNNISNEINNEFVKQKHLTKDSEAMTTIDIKDPSQWKNTKEDVETILNNWTNQNLDTMDFSKSKRSIGEQNRFANKHIFYKKLINGEIMRRNWAIYSISTGNVFCLHCTLFSNKMNKFKTGFCNWKNTKEKFDEHEKSLEHLDSLRIYTMRGMKSGRVDAELEKQIVTEKDYWKNVLKRVISVIKFLATRELAFRGSHERIGEKDNGNYLGTLELLSEYDPFLKNHIAKKANLGRGTTSYLSKEICNEILNILSKSVLQAITKEIKLNKYYSISIDSTPDITHHASLQLSLDTVITKDIRLKDLWVSIKIRDMVLKSLNKLFLVQLNL